MFRRRKNARWCALLAMGLMVLVTSPLAWAAELTPGHVSSDISADTTSSLPATPTPDAAVEQVWRASDGPVADGTAARAWVWGSAPLAITVEHYRDSPTGTRTMVYYDKGRLDILDPTKPTDDAWYVSGALLVSEMLSGEIQFGKNPSDMVRREPAQIPIVGDAGQPDALTYATLAPLATLGATPPARSGALGPTEQDGGSQAAPRRVGQAISALLNGKGVVAPGGVADATIRVGAYDDVTGHNVAAPFDDWSRAQAEPGLYLLGHALTEPYWLDITVNGQPQRVLLQAFERRILTYTPGNPAGYQVESANVGLHYRQWRGLAQPSDPGLIGLASGEPFGEEIVAAATANLIDPYLFVAMERAASGGDPQAQLANGGRGLLGVRAEVAKALNPPDDAAVTVSATDDTLKARVQRLLQRDARHGALPESSLDLADPQRNSGYAAIELSKWLPQSLDWRDILANYYSGGHPGPNDAALNAFVDTTLADYAQLLAAYPHSDDISVPDAAGTLLGTGHAAYYSPSYDRAWWERTLRLYNGWGEISANWQDDPNGYYCVRPGYVPGMRLMLTANGQTIVCTIGDTVATPHLASWRAHWVVELSYSAFAALHLDQNNTVEVFHLGTSAPPAMPDPPAEATPSPTPEPSPTPTDPTPPANSPATPTATPTETPATGTPPADASPSPTPSATPATPTSTPEPTAEPTATATATATETPSDTGDQLLASGQATRAAAGQPVGWWDGTLASLGDGGQALDGWQKDPQGYYCVLPDAQPGARLRVVANGVTIDCTVGDVVPPDQVDAWRAQWALGLSDSAWEALQLDPSSVATSSVEVYAIGS